MERLKTLLDIPIDRRSNEEKIEIIKLRKKINYKNWCLKNQEKKREYAKIYYQKKISSCDIKKHIYYCDVCNIKHTNTSHYKSIRHRFNEYLKNDKEIKN